MTPILLVTPRPAADPCTHPVLLYHSGDKWQCAICGEEVTGLELIDQKHERQSKSRIAKTVKE